MNACVTLRLTSTMGSTEYVTFPFLVIRGGI
jgi:hypothetical protein